MRHSDEKALPRNVHALTKTFEHVTVRLMKYEEIDVVKRETSLAEQTVDAVGHGVKGESENLGSVHIEIRRTRPLRARGIFVAALAHAAGPYDKMIRAAPICPEHKRSEQRLSGFFGDHQRGRCGVPEYGAHAAVVRMNELAVSFRGQKKNMPGLPGSN